MNRWRDFRREMGLELLLLAWVLAWAAALFFSYMLPK